MAEGELLSLALEGRSNISFIITQIIAIEFGLVAGIYFFLGRAGLLLKLFALVIYSIGYGALLSLYFWELAALEGVHTSLAALPAGAPSAATMAILSWETGSAGPIQAVAANAMFAIGWLVVVFLMFVPVGSPPRIRR